MKPPNVRSREIFKSLLRHGALLRPGAPLAAWIRTGGEAELVNEMLCGGVDIDAYHHSEYYARIALQEAAARCIEDLVSLLLLKGADVNAPAKGRFGRTALQMICEYEPASPTEKAEQIRIINHLLEFGADVNAAPARQSGFTALQAAVIGDLEVAMLLLAYDTPADVNMPPCQDPEFGRYDNALDRAARWGRLDTVKLLLNNNALSDCLGNTGYDGAIQAAEEEGHLAVADLLRAHAAIVLRSDIGHANLSQPQRDWREYGYDDYSDGYTTFSEYSDEDAEVRDGETSDSGDEEEDPVAQVQIQDEVVEQPGFAHAALEPGFVWDMEVDESLDFDIDFDDLADGMGSVYGFDYVPSTSNIDTAESFWRLGW